MVCQSNTQTALYVQSERLTTQDVPLNDDASNHFVSRVTEYRDKPVQRVEAYLVTTYDSIGFGTHTALYIHIEGDEPFLYDPGGSYLLRRRGSGGFFVREDFDLRAFIQYHNHDGDDVVMRPFTVSKEQAKSIIDKAMIRDETRDLNCAIDVSSVLMQDYGLTQTYKLPMQLDKVIKEMEEERSGIK